jgi:outer membrane receptor for ferrienterochelin and colicins
LTTTNNFTDLTLQDRISVFQNGVSTERTTNYSLAGRYEDRWGAIAKKKKYRGGTDVYGESIYTKHGSYCAYELPIAEKMLFSFSYTDHDQNSLW